MRNIKFLLFVAAIFVASTAMAKDIWEIQISTSPEGKLGDHSKLIKSILKENVKGYDGMDLKEKTKTLIITFDYDKTSPQEIIDILNAKDPTLKATLLEAVQPVPLSLVKAQEKFEKAKKKRANEVDDLKAACKDYDKAYDDLMDEIKKASKHGYEQKTDVVKTTISISED